MSNKPVIFTIGHWTHSTEDFLKMLQNNDIEFIADIRSFPGSRHSPQFNQEQMQSWLRQQNIDYAHIPNLGGRRKKTDVDQSLINGWEHPSFRNYAGYMQSSFFELGLMELEDLARQHRVTYMCGEPMWWRCHRRMVSDALTARGWEVRHILPGKLQRHELTSFAQMSGTKVTYPGQPMLQLELR